MRILLTNDDGIRAEGIHALRRAVETHLPEANVYVVAPDRERSASGHAITTHRPLLVDEVPLEPGSRSKAWSVSGTPADCAKLAVEALLGLKPDVCLSGINRGANLGTDVFYSGTVSAAIEATILGVPSIAVSLDAFEDCDYLTAAAFAVHLAGKVMEHGLVPGTLLNVNVPNRPAGGIRGVQVTKLGVRLYGNVFEERRDPRGRPYYWLAGSPLELHNDPDSDVVAVSTGRISVSPIRLELTDQALLRDLSSWGLGAWEARDN